MKSMKLVTFVGILKLEDEQKNSFNRRRTGHFRDSIL